MNLTRAEKIAIIRDYVPRLRALIAGLSDEQLTTAYNAPEWTIAQNVHHLVDAHTAAYLRCKLILTEAQATLRSQDQDALAQLPDASDAHIADSLMILEGLHARWARMFTQVTDWDKSGYHPTAKKTNYISLDYLLTGYARHCEAHLQQIQAVIDKMET